MYGARRLVSFVNAESTIQVQGVGGTELNARILPRHCALINLDTLSLLKVCGETVLPARSETPRATAGYWQRLFIPHFSLSWHAVPDIKAELTALSPQHSFQPPAQASILWPGYHRWARLPNSLLWQLWLRESSASPTPAFRLDWPAT